MSHAPSVSLMQIDAAYLATAMGDDTSTTLAALVARRQVFRQHPTNGHKLITAPASDISGQSEGSQRLQLLLQAVAQPALADCTTHNTRPPRIAVVMPAWVPKQEAQALARSVSATNYWRGDATSCYQALSELWPQQEGTSLLLLAVDSLCEATVLKRDDGEGLVHYAGKEVKGWIAGEAAAAVLLRPLARASSLQPRQLGLYRPAVVQAPPNPRWPSDTQGDGHQLRQAMQAALHASGLGLHHISHGLGDCDGATWRAQDRDIALGKLEQDSARPWRGRLITPAEWLGQVGAAWGALQWALAAQMLQHGIEPLNTALSYVQTPNGACAAAVLERATR